MSSGPTRSSSRANGAAAGGSSSAHSSFKSTKGADSKPNPSPQPQPQPHPQAQPAGQSTTTNTNSHKRSASGNRRTTSQATEERRTEERRVTERTYEVHRERHVTRKTSPERIQRRPSTREPEHAKTKSTDARIKEPRVETPLPPWNPVATLLQRTTAPLASRISIPPTWANSPQAPQPPPLAEFTPEEQEAAMIEDLLFVLMGIEGQYIRFGKGYNPHEERDRLSGPTFKILPGLEPSLHDLTHSMLKLATYYSALGAFIDVQSREEFGAVNHALCASIRKFLHEFLNMITQLETQYLEDDNLTIHVLNLHLLPTTQMMMHLYSLAQELLKKNALLDDESEDDDDDDDDDENILEKLREGGELIPGNMGGNKVCHGGVVLGLITKRLEALSGDPAARALLTSLLRDASRPYMVMLNEWLHHGAIKDPHSEFLIKEQKSIRRERLKQDYTDEYWERRYTIRDRDVPPQLATLKDKVLLAGKYLNVVRECGGVDVSKVVKDVPMSFDDSRFLENVNNAYAHANESLMRLLLTTHALPARLRSLKHYFFLDPSDYFSYFLELGSSELRKPVRSVNTGKLQSLLDLVLRQPGSIVSLDPFKEDVKVEMNEITLTKSLQRVVNITGIEQGEALQPLSNQPVESDKNATGFTSLQLDYNVPFPVSLVISRKTVWRYQALFRYLLSLRYLESQLSTTWQTQTRGISWAHRGPNRELEVWKRRVWTLRARMLIFVQQLLYFCTAEVIEPNWNKFMTRLQTNEEDDSQQQQQQQQGGEPSAGGSGSGFMRTVDELMQDHVDFLDTCLKECMLTNSKLLRIHSKLMQTCTIFAAYTNWLTRELEKSDPDLSGSNRPTTMTADQWKRFQATKASGRGSSATNADTSTVSATGDAEARIGNLFEIIRKWESNFSRHLQILLDALNHYAATETVVLLSLCARLSTANQGTEHAGMKTDDDGA